MEHSASFSNKLQVTNGALEFVEPDAEGRLVDNLVMAFDPDELERFATLIGRVWQHITTLNFPDTSKYPPNLRGVQQFEQDLIDGTI